MVDAGSRYLNKMFRVLKRTCKQSLLEPCLWCAKNGLGLILLYIDDGLYFGPGLDKTISDIKGEFDLGVCDTKSTTIEFLGLEISRLVDQYVVSLEVNVPQIEFSKQPEDAKGRRLGTDAATPSEVSGYRSALGKLAWAALADPLLSAPCSIMAGRVASLTVQDIRDLNRIIHNFTSEKKLCSISYKAKQDDPVLVGCSDSSLLNVPCDKSMKGFEGAKIHSQYGGMCFIADGKDMKNKTEGRYDLLDWWSRRHRRICRSSFSAELISCCDLVDKLLFLRRMINDTGVITISKCAILTDCRSVIECLRSSNPQTSEKRLLAEVALLRSLIEEEKLQLGHIAGTHNPADVLTKLDPAVGSIKAMVDKVLDWSQVSMDDFVRR
jgi:hypothetical protein